MTRREVRLHDLVGRMVRDVDGVRVGRVQELHAEIELHATGNDYVVRAFYVGSFGMLEFLAGSRFVWAALRFVRRNSYLVPWQQMDLSDPLHPRVTRPIKELAPAPE